MTKPTRKQIEDEANEAVINEWVATVCYGWWVCSNRYLGQHVDGHHVYQDWYCEHPVTDTSPKLVVSTLDFNPCQDKEDAIELAEKYELEIDFEAKGVTYYPPVSEAKIIWWHTNFNKEPEFWKDKLFTKTWMQAVCKAALICEVEK